MSQPTAAETAFARNVGLKATDVAQARDVLNAIRAMPWPKSVQLALLVGLAQGADADVGTVLGGLALDAAPLDSFERLLPIIGLADKRVAGLARGLSAVTPESFAGAPDETRVLMQQLQALGAENLALRAELDRVKVEASEGGNTGRQVMPLADAAASIGDQLARVDGILRDRKLGLRMAASQIQLRAGATKAGDEVAFDFKAAATSQVGFQFVNAETPPDVRQSAVLVPDVVGYTAVLARRRLAAVGLSAMIAKGVGTSGQVAEQRPVAGDSALPGSVVRLVFG